MFYQNGASNTTYVSTTSLPTSGLKIYSMSDYKTVKREDFGGSLWVYNKGV